MRELDWQIPTTCPRCKDTIYSSYEGEFVVCKCWKESDGKTGIFVDQTRWYMRMGGNQ